MDLLPLLLLPFLACLLLAGIHCYLGIHVVLRGVIFVDLALAQIAALGMVVGLLLGYEPESAVSMGLSVAFTLVGSLLFSLARAKEERVPTEAMIGIAYVIASALAILVLDKSPHGLEEIESMLVGSILFVTARALLLSATIYGLVALVHWRLRAPLTLVSTDSAEARRRGYNVFLLDFTFYATFGLVVSSSVRIAGVLMVFSYLVIPAVIAQLYAGTIRGRLLIGWALGFLGSALGLAASAAWDLPTGAAVVAAFGAILVVALTLNGRVVEGRSPGRPFRAAEPAI